MNLAKSESVFANAIVSDTKLDQWVEAQKTNKMLDLNVYGPPSEQHMKDLENVRKLSKELQGNLQQIENAVRIAEVENDAMTPRAEPLDNSEHHEFMSSNQLDNYYTQEDIADAKEEEKKRLTKGKAAKTEIQEFYRDQCVLLTGGTGFLGKAIIEKLLRTCTDIDTIYLLVRSKKGKEATARIHEMMDDVLFEKALENNPKVIHKVVAINGDFGEPGLGLSAESRKLLTNKVTVIINAAATVRFDETIPLANAINVQGTKEVIKLARECRGLKAITHISTAYANCVNREVEERFYEPPMQAEALNSVSQIDENLLEDITPRLLGKYPNTYCFTKAVAEDAVRRYGEGMPICIVRPSIVVSTYEEPIRGWTDNLYGPTGIMVGIGTGVLRTMYMELDKVADMVPVDLCVNAILSATWDTAKQFKENQTSTIPIYNFVSGARNPMTWRQFIDLNRKHGEDKPTMKAVWYYGINPTNNYFLFLFYNFFLHFLPALVSDVFLAISGRERTMLPLYKKMTKLSTILFYFSTQEWKFKDDNVSSLWSRLSKNDRVVFPFNIADISWDHHCETFLVGLRVYLVKDDLSTLPEARKRWSRMFYMHQALKFVTFALVLNMIYWLFKMITKAVLS